MAKSDIKNKTLLVAKKLLMGAKRKPYLVTGNDNVITLGREDVYELSISEIVEALKRLEDRKLVKFLDKEDKWNENIDYITLSFNKEGLNEFIEAAKDRFYKITTDGYRADLDYVLGALALILQSRTPQTDFSELGANYVSIAEWIADHSAAIKIIYEDEPIVDTWSDPQRPQIFGLTERAKSLMVIDRPILERLENDLREFVIMPQQERIRLFLKKNPAAEWRCANCSHFLMRLESEKQIAGLLNDFYIHKFKICHKCRKRNHFSVTPKGEIAFSITYEEMLGEKSKQEKIETMISQAKARAKNKKRNGYAQGY